jgi:acyl-CoA reductase-like NAD-dependent aldehyde dehydrogenase
MSISTVDTQSETKWHAIAADIKPEVRLFIDGEYVDAVEGGDMTQPFGGMKQSGNAKDKCFESLLQYTDVKSAWIRHG